MRRADRLFQLIQLLRARRLMTAASLGAELEVSERTVYRDIRDLQCSGVPIQGEAGVGYRLPRSFELPPLMFTRQEIQALVLGMRVVQGWADPQLAKAAKSALEKVEVVLPERLRHHVEQTPLHVAPFVLSSEVRERLSLLRDTVERSVKLRFDYVDARGDATDRTVRPLGLFYWGKIWLLTTWCDLRSDFRSFRVDRIQNPKALDIEFEPEPGRRLEDYLQRVEED